LLLYWGYRDHDGAGFIPDRHTNTQSNFACFHCDSAASTPDTQPRDYFTDRIHHPVHYPITDDDLYANHDTIQDAHMDIPASINQYAHKYIYALGNFHSVSHIYPDEYIYSDINIYIYQFSHAVNHPIPSPTLIT
jgi:hypothetical protein